MKSPFELMTDSGSITEVMNLTSDMKPADLEAAAQALSEKQVSHVGVWTCRKLNLRGVQSILITGCLLNLYRLATAREESLPLFANMLKDTGITKTQAYRSLAAWNTFGPLLGREPQLASQFVSESLKMLAAEHAPPAARKAAVELARNGERIDIPRAKKLLREHGAAGAEDTDEESADTPRAASTKKKRQAPAKHLFSFVGKAVRLAIEPTKPGGCFDMQQAIRDLESAIEKFRRDFAHQLNRTDDADAA